MEELEVTTEGEIEIESIEEVFFETLLQHIIQLQQDKGGGT